MAFLLYAATAAGLLFLCHRFVRPITAATALVLALLPLCFTGRALLTGAVYAPVDNAYATEPLLPMRGPNGIGPGYNGILNDIASQMIPWRKAVQWSVRNGQWPLMNPFILSGDILAAAAQPAAYSPFTLLAILLPVAQSFTFTAAMAFFVAGLGAFLFAREIGCHDVPSLIAGAAFMYASGLAFFILWPLGFTWAWFPAVLLATRRIVREPGLASAGLLCATLTLALLSGHPETMLHIVFLGCAYAVTQMAVHRGTILRALLFAAAAGALALSLCAIYLLPVLEAVEQTSEHRSRNEVYAFEERGATTPHVLASLATDFFPFVHARRWLSPGVTGLPIDSAGAGSLALALAVVAFLRRRSVETWFLGAVAIFGLLMRAGWTPLARLVKELPLFDIALNERFGFAASFAMAALAGLGAQALAERWPDRRALLAFAATLLAVTIGTVLIERANLVAPNVERWGDFKIAAEIGCLALATMLIALRTPARWSLPLLLGLLLVQRTASERGVYPVYPSEAAYPPVPIFQPLPKTGEPYRVTGSHLTFIPGTSALYELEDVRGYQAMTNLRYLETYPLWCRYVPVWFNRVEDLTRPFLSFLNVRFAVVWPGYPVPDGWRIFSTQRGATLLENTRALPRAFVPRRVRLGITGEETLRQMEKESDFSERAWIVASLEPHERTNGPGRVSARHDGTGYLLDAEMDADGWIVVSTVAWNGWRAYIDGRRVKMQIANHAFLSVFVPKGKHTVRLVYLPRSFVAGRTVSFITLAAILAAAMLRRRTVY